MDLNRLDTLARFIATAGSRRSLLGLLAALPAAGALLIGHDRDDASAKDRRRRRKQRHRRRKHPGARKRNSARPCKRDAIAQTCAGRCGRVQDSCGKIVDCGSCACDPPCAACFTCQEGPTTPGACVVDPARQGEACGEPGQVCQADGICACNATSCPGCFTCGADGLCLPCEDCCDGDGVCQPGTTDAACGSSGTCGTCAGTTPRCAGQACVACSAANPCPDGLY